MKVILLLLSMILMISCIDDEVKKDDEKDGEGKVNISVNYEGEQALKRVMVAFYTGDTNKIPDELMTLPKNIDGELTFPYKFSVTPKELRKYTVTLLADVEKSGAPERATAAASEYKEVIVVKDGVDVEFTLVDPIVNRCEETCDGWKECVDGNCKLKMGSCEVDTDCSIDGETCNMNNHKCEVASQGIGKINFTVNYEGSENLKRVMVAYYKDSSASGKPDKSETIHAETEGDVITFPLTFSLTPEENRTYYISLKADEKVDGMPNLFGGTGAEAKEVIVTSDGVDVEFMLVD